MTRSGRAAPTTAELTRVESLRCLRCDTAFPFSPEAYLCPKCGGQGLTDPGILDVHYRYESVGERLLADLQQGNRRGVFRYRALLPTDGSPSDLPAGNTALVPAPILAQKLKLGRLMFKDDTRNPTRCLKDRATAVALAMSRATGNTDLYCASAGNAAISLAGFCAHAGVRCHVYVPSYASRERLAWLAFYGADVHVSAGNYDTAFDEAEAAGRKGGWYSRNCAFNPFLVEGKKTAAFEIAEALDWMVPDVVVAPVGDGCTLSALGKGFRELRQLGITDRTPKLLGVQAEAMQPLVRRWNRLPGEDAGRTSAASINVRRPRNALRLMKELASSDGAMVSVPDDVMVAAQTSLAREAGIVVELTAAAGLAGLATAGYGSDATVVVVLTGGRTDG